MTVADHGAQFRAAFTNTCPVVYTTTAILTVRHFTEPVIAKNQTGVRAVHWQEIRDRILELRMKYGASPAQYSYTNATLARVTVADIVEARNALAGAYAAAGRTAPVYTNAVISTTTKVSKTDLDELRAACVGFE